MLNSCRLANLLSVRLKSGEICECVLLLRLIGLYVNLFTLGRAGGPLSTPVQSSPVQSSLAEPVVVAAAAAAVADKRKPKTFHDYDGAC